MGSDILQVDGRKKDYQCNTVRFENVTLTDTVSSAARMASELFYRLTLDGLNMINSCLEVEDQSINDVSQQY